MVGVEAQRVHCVGDPTKCYKQALTLLDLADELGLGAQEFLLIVDLMVKDVVVSSSAHMACMCICISLSLLCAYMFIQHISFFACLASVVDLRDDGDEEVEHHDHHCVYRVLEIEYG